MTPSGPAAASDPLAVSVTKGTPTLAIYAPNGDTWLGLTTIPVSWDVDGPPTARSSSSAARRPSARRSRSPAPARSPIPAFDRSQNGNRLTLEYSGSTTWNSGSTSRTGTIVACIPAQASTSNPANSATVSIGPDPSCGGGTGYYATDLVSVSAHPIDGYTVTGFSGGTVNGSVRWPYASSDVTLYPINGSASMLIHPPLEFAAGGQIVPFGIQANTQAQCVEVKFSVFGIANRSDALNILSWNVPQNTCGTDVRFGTGNSYYAKVPNGATVSVSYQAGFIPANIKFYGWEGQTSADRFARSATYVIGPDTRKITANFGPICTANGPKVTQPTYGTITVNLPAPNCNDPSTGTSGYIVNTPGTATLVDSVGKTVQVISSSYGSLNGRMQRIDELAWLPEKPIFFDGWRGDTGVVDGERCGHHHRRRRRAAHLAHDLVPHRQHPDQHRCRIRRLRRADHEGARRQQRRHARHGHDEHAVELPGRRGHQPARAGTSSARRSASPRPRPATS